MIERIAGFEWRPIVGRSGIGYVDTPTDKRPWRLILHTTEGTSSIEGEVNRYARTGNYPHATVDPRDRRRAQHVSLLRAVTTAKNAPGGVETNRFYAVQVEIIGRADDVPGWSPELLEWVGAEVIAPIVRAVPAITLRAPRFVGREAGFIARPDAPQRMSAEDWLAFDGVAGHQHVPENDHWDPGRLDIATVLYAARSELDRDTRPVPAPDHEEDSMHLVKVKGDTTETIYGVSGMFVARLTPRMIWELTAAKVIADAEVREISDATLKALIPTRVLEQLARETHAAATGARAEQR